ncbi:MAG: SDR family NAD(P)-dependent oxidoreductase [Promethearchaeota archaeon]
MPKQILKGKNIIIFGASTGIGKALAFGMAELGANVALVSRSRQKLEQNVKEIRQKNWGSNAVYHVADVSIYAQVEEAIRCIAEEFGSLHVLINNAAFAPIEMKISSVELIDKVININLKGTLYASFAIMPYFENVKNPSIINTSSVAGLNRWDGASPLYDITKAAINRFTTTRNSEYEMKRIRINSILPGWVDTPMISYIPKNVLQSMIREIGISMMKPEDLVPYYVFFASDQSKRVTKKLVNIVSFQRAFKYIEENIPKDIPRKYNALKDLLQPNVSYGTFSNITENRKLFDFILNYEEILKD